MVSNDGVSWTETSILGVDNHRISQVFVHGNALLGFSKSSGTSALFYSYDKLNWARVELPITIESMTVGGDTVVLAAKGGQIL